MSPNRRPPRLNKTELRSIIESYRARFPNWTIIQKDTLVREGGPVIQGITFERLSGGEYRPTGHIRVLVAPEDVWGFELPQLLNLKLRQIDRQRDTAECRDRVIQAIQSEFVPKVDKPLIAEQVLALYEEKAYPTSAEAYSLAALNAYLGHSERAVYWCSRFAGLVDATGNGWQDFDCRRRAFLEQLGKWLEAGTARQELQLILDKERHKWGLV
jgi:hypothetical protein